MIKQKIAGMIFIACGIISALDDIEQRIKEHVQEHKAKDHKQEVLELEYTAVVELMRHLSDER